MKQNREQENKKTEDAPNDPMMNITRETKPSMDQEFIDPTALAIVNSNITMEEKMQKLIELEERYKKETLEKKQELLEARKTLAMIEGMYIIFRSVIDSLVLIVCIQYPCH